MSLFRQIFATFGFFTRLPLWKIMQVDKSFYEHVVPYWPIIGYLNGLMMFAVVYATTSLPAMLTAVLCLIARVLLTGCLHEDGFADFCDGFGGGYDKDSILRIMKDSHIGTYGVVGLVFYFLVQVNTLSAVVADGASLFLLFTLIFADSYCKFVSSTITIFLPYVRKESESKNRLVYERPSVNEIVSSIIITFIPLGLAYYFCGSAISSFIVPCVVTPIVAVLLFQYMRKNIGGYTGDCCGATFVITEVVFYLCMII